MIDTLKRAAPPRTVLVLGGARSGKSRYAESLALKSGLSRLYVATSPIIDAETRDRVALHKAQRGAGWRTVEEETDVAGVLECEAGPERIILVDCLTLWLNNLFFKNLDAAAETGRLCHAVSRLKGPAIFVSNEIGLGLVPESKLSRDFRDAQGRINQAMAEACQSVVFVAAGLPLTLKPSSQPDVIL